MTEIDEMKDTAEMELLDSILEKAQSKVSLYTRLVDWVSVHYPNMVLNCIAEDKNAQLLIINKAKEIVGEY